MQLVEEKYEYAGFQYEIKYDGERYWAFALPGQHSAADKQKHRRAALEQYGVHE
jgi:ATP-dependent DNA ligase